jgi:hypothetical protein
MATDSQTAIANRHDFDTSFTNEYDLDQTAVTVITPTTGTTVEIKGVYINTEGDSGYIRIYFGTSLNSIFTVYPASTPASGYVPLYISGARNEVIKITSTVGAQKNYFVLINYKEK